VTTVSAHIPQSPQVWLRFAQSLPPRVRSRDEIGFVLHESSSRRPRWTGGGGQRSGTAAASRVCCAHRLPVFDLCDLCVFARDIIIPRSCRMGFSPCGPHRVFSTAKYANHANEEGSLAKAQRAQSRKERGRGQRAEDSRVLKPWRSWRLCERHNHSRLPIEPATQ
jgi:hypothetical protein